MTTALEMYMVPQGSNVEFIFYAKTMNSVSKCHKSFLRESKYTPNSLGISETMVRTIASSKVTSC